MDQGGSRIGTVSSVDARTGMVSVVYGDLDGKTTEPLPYATFNDEYKPPKPGAKVVVLRLSNGGEMGIVLGTYWNKANVAGNQGEYHKELADGAYFDYSNQRLTIAAKQIRFLETNRDTECTIAGILEDIRSMKELLGIV